MIKLPAYFTRFGSKSDGSASLSFATQEIGAEEFAELQRNLNGFGWLVFKENEVKAEDIPKTDAEEEGKTRSEILRAVIWRIWEKKGKQGDSDTHYRKVMDSLIEKLKAQIDS